MLPGPLVTRLDRYMFRQLAVALVAVTGGLAVLIWLVQSLRFVELVVNRGLSIGVFLQLTGLLLPSFVAVILPITSFVVVQFTYQRLAGDRELTVMRAAGLSPLALARPALFLAFLVMLSGYLLNLWLVPSSLSAFREFQWEIRNRVAAFLLQEGVFTSMSNDLTVYVRSRDRDGSLRGILVDDARQPGAHATILAERGRLVEGPSGPRVLLVNGSRQELDRQTGRLNILTFSENAIDLAQAARHEVLLGRKTATERIASFLLDLRQRSGARHLRTQPLALPMTRSEIADYTGLTIETVSRVLGRLRSAKIIELMGASAVRILDEDELGRLSGSRD